MIMNLATHIITKCGGPQAVADMLNISFTAVYRWTYAREKGGTGGLIPTRRQQELIEAAWARGIKLTPSDFFTNTSPAAAPPCAADTPPPE